ncbi:MAG: hypothetical protein V1682_00815 [Candidatus Omnitrophota bacterium]
MNNKLIEAQDVFLTKINQMCGRFGLNNIMAQLYAILYLSAKPLSLDDMVERLKISKGSASVNIRALERYRVVRRVWVKGSRKDYYEAESDISKVIMDRIRSMAMGRLSEVKDMITSSREVINAVIPENGSDDEFVKTFKERLDRLQAIYDQAQGLFELFNATILTKEYVAPAKEPERKAALVASGNGLQGR